MPLDKRLIQREEQAPLSTPSVAAQGSAKANTAAIKNPKSNARIQNNAKNREPIERPAGPREYAPGAPDPRWYEGSEPTAAEIAGRISDIYGRDQEKGTRLWQQFTQLTMDKTSKYYQPYATPTNSAMINGLAALGVDVSGGITQEWLQTNLANYRGALDGITSDTTGSVSAPKKRPNSRNRDQWIAYYLYQLNKDEARTQQAEAEWAELQNELTQKANDRIANLSDQEILDSIDWSRYKALTQMDEYAANGSPEMLNRAIGYNRDMLQGVIWAARNKGGTGNLMLDAASAARGLGVGYTALPSFTGGMIGDEQRLQAQIDAARAEVRNTQHLPMDNRAAQARLDELLKQQETMRAQNNEAMRRNGGLWEFGGQQMPYLPDAIGGSYTAFSPKGEQTSTPFGQLNVPAGESTGELRYTNQTQLDNFLDQAAELTLRKLYTPETYEQLAVNATDVETYAQLLEVMSSLYAQQQPQGQGSSQTEGLRNFTPTETPSWYGTQEGSDAPQLIDYGSAYEGSYTPPERPQLQQFGDGQSTGWSNRTQADKWAEQAAGLVDFGAIDSGEKGAVFNVPQWTGNGEWRTWSNLTPEEKQQIAMRAMVDLGNNVDLGWSDLTTEQKRQLQAAGLVDLGGRITTEQKQSEPVQLTNFNEEYGQIGQYGRGNIDLYNRPVLQNEDGSISTVESFSTNIDGMEVLLPTIINGQRVSEDDAIQHYFETGEYLGKFETVEEADRYAMRLHNEQDRLYGSSVQHGPVDLINFGGSGRKTDAEKRAEWAAGLTDFATGQEPGPITEPQENAPLINYGGRTRPAVTETGTGTSRGFGNTPRGAAYINPAIAQMDAVMGGRVSAAFLKKMEEDYQQYQEALKNASSYPRAPKDLRELADPEHGETDEDTRKRLKRLEQLEQQGIKRELAAAEEQLAGLNRVDFGASSWWQNASGTMMSEAEYQNQLAAIDRLRAGNEEQREEALRLQDELAKYQRRTRIVGQTEETVYQNDEGDTLTAQQRFDEGWNLLKNTWAPARFLKLFGGEGSLGAAERGDIQGQISEIEANTAILQERLAGMGDGILKYREVYVDDGNGGTQRMYLDTTVRQPTSGAEMLSGLLSKYEYIEDGFNEPYYRTRSGETLTLQQYAAQVDRANAMWAEEQRNPTRTGLITEAEFNALRNAGTAEQDALREQIRANQKKANELQAQLANADAADLAAADRRAELMRVWQSQRDELAGYKKTSRFVGGEEQAYYVNPATGAEMSADEWNRKAEQSQALLEGANATERDLQQADRLAQWLAGFKPKKQEGTTAYFGPGGRLSEAEYQALEAQVEGLQAAADGDPEALAAYHAAFREASGDGTRPVEMSTMEALHAFDDSWQPSDALDVEMRPYDTYVNESTIRGTQKAIEDAQAELAALEAQVNDPNAPAVTSETWNAIAQKEMEIEQLKEQLAGLEADPERWAATVGQLQNYRGLMDNPDFARLSRVRTDVNDYTYNYINGIGGARAQGDAVEAEYGGDYLKKFRNMSAREKQVYNYLYATEGAEAAQGFLDSIGQSLDKRYTQQAVEEWEKYTEEHPLGANVMSLLMTGSGLIGTAYMAGSELITGDFNPYSQAFLPARYGDTVMEKTSAMINEATEKYGEGWQVAANLGYSTLYSMVQSAIAMMAGTGGEILLGGNAAASATLEAIENGASTGEAATIGIMAGVFETLFEHVSLDKVIKIANGQGASTIFRNLIKQSFVEASEEFCTEAANMLTEYLVRGDASEVANMTPAEMAYRLGMASAGGALSGAGFGVGGSLVNSYNVYRQGRELSNGLNAQNGDYAAFVREGLEAPKGTDAYNMAKRNIKRMGGENAMNTADLSAYRLGQQYIANQRAMAQEQRDAAYDEILKSGRTKKESGQIADVFDKIYNGEEISTGEAELILGSTAARDMIEKMTGQSTDGFTADDLIKAVPYAKGMLLDTVEAAREERAAKAPEAEERTERPGETGKAEIAPRTENPTVVGTEGEEKGALKPRELATGTTQEKSELQPRDEPGVNAEGEVKAGLREPAPALQQRFGQTGGKTGNTAAAGPQGPSVVQQTAMDAVRGLLGITAERINNPQVQLVEQAFGKLLDGTEITEVEAAAILRDSAARTLYERLTGLKLGEGVTPSGLAFESMNGGNAERMRQAAVGMANSGQTIPGVTARAETEAEGTGSGTAKAGGRQGTAVQTAGNAGTSTQAGTGRARSASANNSQGQAQNAAQGGPARFEKATGTTAAPAAAPAARTQGQGSVQANSEADLAAAGRVTFENDGTAPTYAETPELGQVRVTDPSAPAYLRRNDFAGQLVRIETDGAGNASAVVRTADGGTVTVAAEQVNTADVGLKTILQGSAGMSSQGANTMLQLYSPGSMAPAAYVTAYRAAYTAALSGAGRAQVYRAASAAGLSRMQAEAAYNAGLAQLEANAAAAEAERKAQTQTESAGTEEQDTSSGPSDHLPLEGKARTPEGKAGTETEQETRTETPAETTAETREETPAEMTSEAPAETPAETEQETETKQEAGQEQEVEQETEQETGAGQEVEEETGTEEGTEEEQEAEPEPVRKSSRTQDENTQTQRKPSRSQEKAGKGKALKAGLHDRAGGGGKRSRSQKANVAALEALAEKYGVAVVLEDRIETLPDGTSALGATAGRGLNGYYDPATGEIHIGMDAVGGAYAAVAMHELVHHLKATNAKGFRELADFARDWVSVHPEYSDGGPGLWQRRIERIAAERGISTELAEEEMLADFIPAVLANEDAARDLYNESPTVFRRILDWITDALAAVREATLKFVFGADSTEGIVMITQYKHDLYAVYEVFNAIMEQGPSAQEEDGGVRFSVKPENDGDPEVKRLRKENEKLSAAVNALEAQFKLTKGHHVSGRSVDLLAGRVLRDAVSRYPKAKLSEGIQEVFDYIANDEAPNMDEVMDHLTEICMDVIGEARILDEDIDEDAQRFRNWVSGTQIALSAKQKAEIRASYDTMTNFRKAVRRRFELNDTHGVSLDSIWGELHEEFPYLIDEDVTEPDQPLALLRALDACDRHYYNPYERYYGRNTRAAAQDMALQIFDNYFTLPETKTYADRMLKQKNDALYDQRERMQNRYDSMKARYEARIHDVRMDARARYQEKLKELRAKKNAQLLELTRKLRDANEADKERYREMIRKTRSEGWERFARLRAAQQTWVAEDRARRNERARSRVLRERIEKNVKNLYRLLERPTEQKHVHDAFQGAVGAFLESIDFAGNKDTKRAQAWRERAATLANMLAGRGNSVNLDEIGFVVDPDISDALSQMLEASAGVQTVADLGVADLERLDRVVRGVRHMLRTVDRSFAQDKARKISALAGSTIEDMDSRRENRNFGRTMSAVRKFFKYNMLSADSFMELLDEGGGQPVFRGMRQALDQRTWMIQDSIDAFGKMKQELGISDAMLNGWEKDKVKVKLGGHEVEMTTAQLMELYALSKRQQAVRHLTEGGIELMDDDGRTRRRYVPAPADLTALGGKLDPKARALADRMQEYLSTTASGWGNEASLRVFGLRKFNEQNYWPIKSSSAFLSTQSADPNATGENDLHRLRNMGSAKTLVPHANNPVSIRSAFSTFSGHVGEMSNYGAMMPAIEDALRWFNYRNIERDEETGEVLRMESVKESLKYALGTDGIEWITNLIRDLSAIPGGEQSRLLGLDTITRHATGANVAFNASVAIQQPTAIVRASMEMNPRYLAMAAGRMASKNYGVRHGIEMMRKHVGIAAWKNMGFFDANISRGLKAAITGESTVLDKIRDVGMKGAEKGDEITWAVLWNACELETRDAWKKAGRAKEIGTEAFYEAVGERMSRIIDRTQVVDSPWHRTQLMRSKDSKDKMFTAYQSEPAKTYNMLFRQVAAIARSIEKDGIKAIGGEAGRKLARALIVYAINALAAAAAQSLITALRDPNKDKSYWERYWADLQENFGNNINPLGMLPLFGDIIEMMINPEAYAPSTVVTGVFDSIKTVRGGWESYLSGDSSKSVYYYIYQTSKVAGSLTGVSVGNIMREFNAVAEEIKPGTILMTKLATTSTMTNALLWGNNDLAVRAATAYMREQTKAGTAEKKVNSTMRSQLTRVFKPLYQEAWRNGDTEEMARIRGLLGVVELGESRYDAGDYAKWIEEAKEEMTAAARQ